MALSKSDRSVFVVVSFASEDADCDRGILYEFKIKEGGQIIVNGVEHEGTLGGYFNSALYNTLAEFSKGGDNLFRCARFGSSSKLFVFHDKLDRGLVFDTTTTTTQTTTMSMSSSSLGCGSFTRPTKHNTEAPLISAYGNLYYLADRLSRSYSTDTTTFQRYDPNTDSWDNLPPCPFCSIQHSIDWSEFSTIGFAVSSGCILFSLKLTVWRQFEFLVYHIATQSWHKVSKPSGYFPLRGRAVVVDDHTIYAASYSNGCMHVLQFSLHVPPNPADGPYFIESFTVLSGLEVVTPPQSSLQCRICTYYMVHLGDLDFCLVYNYNHDLYRQNLCITTFRIVAGSSSSMQQHIETLHSTVADFYLQPNTYNHIVFSFTSDYDDDDTKCHEDKSETTVEPAKYKSVRAFDAKEGTTKKMRGVE